MKIEDILKEQGEIYKNLTSNETIRECDETIKPPKLVQYKLYMIPEQEYKAIKELEKLLGIEPGVVDEYSYDYYFEISIKNNQITYLRIYLEGLINIPKQINNLTNLRELHLSYNEIAEIKNIDNLRNLKELGLSSNQITEIKGLDNFPSLEELYLHNNPIKNKEEVIKLRNKGIVVHL